MYRHGVKEILDNHKCETIDDALDVILGGYDNDYWTDLVVYRRCEDTKTTMLNRFNTLWVYPIFIVCIPFRYVLFGETGFNRDTKFGKFVLDLVGQ